MIQTLKTKKWLSGRMAAGSILAVLVLLVCGKWYTLKDGILWAGAFLAAGVIRIPVKNPWLRFGLNGFWGVVCIFLCCCIPSIMIAESSFLQIGAYRIAMNLACAAFVFGLCLVLTGRIKAAVALASGLLLFLATVNGFVFQFRGNEFKPTDIYAAETAFNVAGKYVWRISWNMVSSWLLGIWMLFCLGCLPSDEKLLPGQWMRIGAVAASLLCLAVILKGYGVIHPNNWSNGGTTHNGYYLNFAVNLRDSTVRRPDGYNRDTVAQLEQQYAAEDLQPQSRPNIVIIMSESFSDVRVFGGELRTNETVMPFLDSLQENTIRGNALTSVFGGVTANAEFEVLTGSTMAFLPEGSVAYQQYVREDALSLARILEKQGYATLATHPYLSTGWSRTTVYPRLGLENMTFQEDYPREDMVREYISDREMYNYVLDALESTQEPLFLFGITMQNHGDYIYTGDNYTQTVFLEGYREDYPMAEQYLSLIRETDEATREWIRALEESDEDTVVLFFGDHLPQIESSFYEELYGGPFETLPEQLLQYTVPFYVWANFDIPEQTVACSSLNYLPVYLLKAAGLPLSPYYRFLEELEQQIPAISAMGYYSLSQGTFLETDQAQGLEREWLDRYRILQYNHWFDGKDRSEVFFGQFIPEGE